MYIVHVVTNERSLIIRCGRDRMVVGFTTTYAFSSNHH